jgi:TetR/AcrR family transcriptional regulator, cholesterol catabolism regulator
MTPGKAAENMQRQPKIRKHVPVWRKADRTSRIYRVAAQIMCRRGYEATSMNEIADAVGLTKAGMYYYIQGKEDLLFKIMSFAMDMVEMDVVAPAREALDAEERLRTLMERHVRRILEVGGAVTILLDEMPSLTAAHQRIIRGRKRVYFDLVRETLEQLASEGKLRAVNPAVAAFSLLGMIIWISRWYHRDGLLSADAVLKDVLEMALNGVLKEVASPRALPPAKATLV